MHAFCAAVNKVWVKADVEQAADDRSDQVGSKRVAASSWEATSLPHSGLLQSVPEFTISSGIGISASGDADPGPESTSPADVDADSSVSSDESIC